MPRGYQHGTARPKRYRREPPPPSPGWRGREVGCIGLAWLGLSGLGGEVAVVIAGTALMATPTSTHNTLLFALQGIVWVLCLIGAGLALSDERRGQVWQRAGLRPTTWRWLTFGAALGVRFPALDVFLYRGGNRRRPRGSRGRRWFRG